MRLQKEEGTLNLNLRSQMSMNIERWFNSTNAKDIGTLYLIFALFSGLLGTAFSVLIRLELSGPGVQFIANNQLYKSIITAHAILMIFFMVDKRRLFNLNFQSSSKFYNNHINSIIITDDNNNNNNNNDEVPKYTKVFIENPFNNRKVILKVAKNQKGIPSPTPNYLNPHWVTGFSDAESCFGFRVRKNLNLKVGWEVIPYFSINLQAKDLSILLEIKEFFGVGNISSNKETALYQVNSIKDLVKVIIPHFELYPLLTKKRADFLLFRLAIELIKQKEHKNIEGIHKLIGIKASLNKGLLNKELNSSFKNIVPQERTEVPLPEVINPYWFAGFTSGDGSFSVEILKSSSHKIGYQVILKFLIIQHSRDLELLKCFISFLGGGFIKERTSISGFFVVKLSLITDKLIPLFHKYPIIGNKNKDFLDFCQIAELMNSNAHKTREGIDKILEIKSGMNTKRK